MSKKYEKQLMKFELTKDKLKMEIKLKDLVFLFENNPNNFGFEGEGLVKVKRGKRQEFAEFIIKRLMDDCDESEGDAANWGLPFEKAFMDIFEGYEDEFIKYPKEDE